MRKDKQKKLLWLLDRKYITVNPIKGYVIRHRYCGEPRVTGSLSQDGYLQTKLCVKDGTLNVRIHQIIYLYVHRYIPDNMQIDHIDGDKLNNRIHNLQLLTKSANIIKSHTLRDYSYCIGERNGSSKLTEKEVLSIRQKYIPRRYTAKQLAKEYGVSTVCVKEIIQRRKWRHI